MHKSMTMTKLATTEQVKESPKLNASRLAQVFMLAFALLTSQAFALDPAVSASDSTPVSLHQQIGTVKIVLGKAERYSANGKRMVIRKDSQIQVGDRIVTPSNGHVHIHFIDGALVSVRPNSELHIERYDYDQDRPELSAVKFNLQEGVTRSISGDAARSARERFRLNTPIAAIGVRGTDFVVSADEDTTRALVNEGVIVMAPFSDACSVDALGPCLANALELTNTLQMVAMDESAPLPRLLPAQAITNQDSMREEVQLAIASSSQSEETTNLVVSGDPEAEPVQTANNEALLEGATTTAVTVDAAVAVAVALAPPEITDFTPDRFLNLGDVSERQLIWGHYSDIGLETDRLAIPFEDASENREITIGNLDYGLFRIEDDARRLDSGLGIIGFQLSSAQAVFNSNTGVVAMEVGSGSLNINFPDSSFNTELNLSHEITGAVDIVASGRLFDGGFLRAIEETQRVTGAVSFDGSEAGYLFEKQIEGGEVSGLTLWDAGFQVDPQDNGGTISGVNSGN